MTIVLDTNVIISALLKPDSIPGRILEQIIRGHIRLVISPHLRSELQRALGYPRVRRLLLSNLTDEEVNGLPEQLARIALHVVDVEPG
jgi:putative PIN family toxin of toxin-antitoxin system